MNGNTELGWADRIEVVLRTIAYPALRHLPASSRLATLATAKRQTARHPVAIAVLYMFALSLMALLIARNLEQKWLLRPSGWLALIMLVALIVVPQAITRLSLRRLVRTLRQ